MLSRHKTAIRTAELVSLVSVIGALFMACYGHFTFAKDSPFELVALLGVALLTASFLPACMLGGEFASVISRFRQHNSIGHELSGQEIATLVRWAPTWQKAAGLLAFPLVAITAVGYGSISWHDDQQLTSSDLTGISLYLTAFFLAALPILGSARRMPGTYADWY